MVYITVKTLLGQHRTYAFEENAYVNIDGQHILAKNVEPNTWWDDEYITETEVKN